MTFEFLKRSEEKEYLGYCERKGFVYSVCKGEGRYEIVALNDGDVETLIAYVVRQEDGPL